MFLSSTNIYASCVLITLLVLFHLISLATLAQQAPITLEMDTISPKRNLKREIRDTLLVTIDTAVQAGKTFINGKLSLDKGKNEKIKRNFSSGVSNIKKPKLDSNFLKVFRFDTYSFRQLFERKLLLKYNGGFISYNFNHRSNIDTPFLEKNITQHNITGNLNFTVAGNLPFTVNYWSRQSNSVYFRNITDVQIIFDATRFRNLIQKQSGNYFTNLLPHLRDSLTEELYSLKNLKQTELEDWLQNPFHQQKLIECNELLNVPNLTDDPGLPDSINNKKADSLRRGAKEFLELYQSKRDEYEKSKTVVDSLKEVYENGKQKIQQLQRMIETGAMDWSLLQKWKNQEKDSLAKNIKLPRQLSWLMGIRNFGLGRNSLNYSELTAKNISINGINIEYNSWYYLALSAGVLDYRFRDFVVNRSERTPQYFYMARVGVGRLEKNYFIVSVYKGQKRLFRTVATNSQRPLAVMNITGVSLEAKIQVLKNAYVIGEVAESIAPDFRTNPPERKTGLNFSDKTNKAYAFKLNANLPRTSTRIDAMYKYTGANFQSFSVFQSNAAINAWYIKLEQYFFKRRLRINAAIKKNEFTNPFLTQPYNSNAVFKSLQATLRIKRWPVVMIGYIPMSQLSVAGNQVIESQYQVFNASAYHYYKLGAIRANSMVMMSRFYNSVADTSLFYYNSVNVLVNQSFYFSSFTVTTGFSQIKNRDYELNVLEESISVPVKKAGSFGIGCKINNLDRKETKVSVNFNAGIYLKRFGSFSVQYERGYLPGISKALVRNEMASAQLTKTF